MQSSISGLFLWLNTLSQWPFPRIFSLLIFLRQILLIGPRNRIFVSSNSDCITRMITDRIEHFHQQDRFACIKNINKLGDCVADGKEYIPQIVTWQFSLQLAYWENKIRKITELRTGPPYWCSDCGTPIWRPKLFARRN